jgi:hypothetical protein
VADHFECVGVAGEDEFFELLGVALERGDASAFDGGFREIVWRDDGGASLAVSLTSDGEVICARPSFAAAPRVPARLGAVADDPECAFCSRLLLDVVDEADELVYPLAVELERLAPARDPAAGGRRTTLALTAFAETIEAWPDEDAYDAAHPSVLAGDEPAQPSLAPQSLIPTGLFAEEPKRRRWRRSEPPAPTAHALMTGIVRAAEVRRNSVTLGEFAWLEVETYGASYDVVAAAADADGIGTGAVVQGMFWLIAALRD